MGFLGGLGNILKTIGPIASIIPGIGTAIGAGATAAGAGLSAIDGGGESAGGGGGKSNLLETAMPGMVQGGFGLLGSLLSGKAKEKEMKQEFEMYQKKGAEQKKRINESLKPELARYNIEKDLSTIDPALKKMIFGRLTDVMGSESLSKYGVDPAALLASFSGGGGGSVHPITKQPEGTFAGNRIPGDIAERVMSKYGGHIGKRTERATEV